MSSVSSKLRERVTIDVPEFAEDGFGGTLGGWRIHATMFAGVTPILGVARESLFAERRNARAGYRVTIRYRSDITEDMCISWKNHVLYIHSRHEEGELLHLLTYEENV